MHEARWHARHHIPRDRQVRALDCPTSRTSREVDMTFEASKSSLQEACFDEALTSASGGLFRRGADNETSTCQRQSGASITDKHLSIRGVPVQMCCQCVANMLLQKHLSIRGVSVLSLRCAARAAAPTSNCRPKKSPLLQRAQQGAARALLCTL